MARFTLPRDLYYGPGSLSQLRELHGSKAVLVLGGGSMKRYGFVDRALSYLKEAGIDTTLIEGVEQDPSVETVLRGAQRMRELCPDLILSMGGGSPIDAAKAMWVFYEHPQTTFESLITPFSFPELRTKARFVAIPSTSGTATEVTAFSVVTDYAKGIKYPLADFNITPDIAILDPDLAQTMPQALTANTGMDALTHAVEAYVSTLHSPFTDPLALKAVSMVVEHLSMVVFAIVIAILIGVPVGVLTAVFLAELAPRRLAGLVRPAGELLAGLPSVSDGFFGMMVGVPFIRRMFPGSIGDSLLAMILILAVMVLPTIIQVSETALRAVPASYREASLALGNTRIGTIFRVMLPAARSGILAGVILGVGRAIGETMAVIMVCGNTVNFPELRKAGRPLTTGVVLELSYSSGLHRQALFSIGLVLFVFIMIVNIAFTALSKRGVRIDGKE